ncbi:MAG TPA: YggS family pyridoxal phosphate-dependent enzyme [Mycobacteriales bacterium]|nr:YggS family pyridoxal phosphate-dependent enzyme [Mycobacteriales bacterium]
MTGPTPDPRRAAEIAANLADVNARISAACLAAGRDPAELTLIAVTKTFPASDIAILAGLGVTDIGENRDQEAAPKHDECGGLGLRWHFVGQLQRRKSGSVAKYADVVHSVDRLELADALARAADSAGRSLTALIQVSLDPSAAEHEGRGGASPRAVAELADRIAGVEPLRLGGVMGVAPLGGSSDDAFEQLAQVSRQLRRTHPAATIVSAGMTGDFESAIRHGATHLRIGSALLGPRSGVVG